MSMSTRSVAELLIDGKIRSFIDFIFFESKIKFKKKLQPRLGTEKDHPVPGFWISRSSGLKKFRNKSIATYPAKYNNNVKQICDTLPTTSYRVK